MTDPFSFGIGVLFRDAASIPATFHAGGSGAGLPVRVIRSQPDQLVGFGDGDIVMATNLLDIQRSDIADPVTGDEVQLYLNDLRTVPGDRLRLAGQGRLDEEGLTWRCPAEPV
ncbi:head-tail joining protein [Rhizorhabdus histidinilytica]|uniref:head-tail joining protein n=1 Tax=Rhizorhabdus histidinilytica TaxID=439228 RepID=UPI0032203F9E